MEASKIKKRTIFYTLLCCLGVGAIIFFGLFIILKTRNIGYFFGLTISIYMVVFSLKKIIFYIDQRRISKLKALKLEEPLAIWSFNKSDWQLYISHLKTISKTEQLYKPLIISLLLFGVSLYTLKAYNSWKQAFLIAFLTASLGFGFVYLFIHLKNKTRLNLLKQNETGTVLFGKTSIALNNMVIELFGENFWLQSFDIDTTSIPSKIVLKVSNLTARGTGFTIYDVPIPKNEIKNAEKLRSTYMDNKN